jgi:hypothetical protein
MTYPILKTTKAKTVAAAIGGVVTVATAVFADDVLNLTEAWELGGVIVAAAGTVYAVFKTPNKPAS